MVVAAGQQHCTFIEMRESNSNEVRHFNKNKIFNPFYRRSPKSSKSKFSWLVTTILKSVHVAIRTLIGRWNIIIRINLKPTCAKKTIELGWANIAISRMVLLLIIHVMKDFSYLVEWIFENHFSKICIHFTFLNAYFVNFLHVFF